MNRSTAFVISVLLAVGLCLEGMSYATGRVLARRGILYRAEAAPDYAGYLARRHPVLGWPSPTEDPDGEERDQVGSRRVPAFPDPAAAEDCGSLYGDSFTWASDVSAERAWGNRLALRLGCRVANFGVAGYGSDQAFLRYRENKHDRADFVVLAHLTENVLRNVNQYRALLYSTSRYGFKPRFVAAADGGLRLIGLPRIAVSDYPRFLENPGRYLTHEYFAPGGASGLRALRFPYTLAIAGAFRHFHIQTQLRGVPWYADFYRADHPSGALAVTVAIIEKFDSLARDRGQHPLPVVLPTSLDLEAHASTGAWLHQPLVDALASRGIAVLDVAPMLVEPSRGMKPEQLFTATGHYTERGNALVAEIVGEAIETLAIR